MNDEILVCPVSKWYLRRLAMLVALTGGLGLYFLYDGSIGYPKKNHLADLHEIFEATSRGEAAGPFPDEGTRSEKQRKELEAARRAARDGASWAGFAAERMLSESAPKRYSEGEIREQFRFAILMALIALAIAAFGASRRKRAFRADAEGISFPDGKRIAYAEMLEIDLRKWDRGVAKVRYSAPEGEERVAKIDDYKYAGTTAILKRARETNPAIGIEGDLRWLEASAGEEGEPGADREA